MLCQRQQLSLPLQPILKRQQCLGKAVMLHWPQELGCSPCPVSPPAQEHTCIDQTQRHQTSQVYMPPVLGLWQEDVDLSISLAFRGLLTGMIVREHGL